MAEPTLRKRKPSSTKLADAAPTPLKKLKQSSPKSFKPSIASLSLITLGLIAGAAVAFLAKTYSSSASSLAIDPLLGLRALLNDHAAKVEHFDLRDTLGFDSISNLFGEWQASDWIGNTDFTVGRKLLRGELGHLNETGREYKSPLLPKHLLMI